MAQRVVVVGAGVLGAAVAHRLAEAGADVVVVDMARPGAGTSLATLAWVNAVDKQPEAYFRLNLAGAREHVTLQEAVGGRWLHRGGALEWAGDDEGAAALREKAARLEAWGYGVEVLRPSEVAALEPDVRLPAGGGHAAAPGDAPAEPAGAPPAAAGDAPVEVLHYPEDAWAQPAAMIGALLRAAVRAGAQVRSGCTVTSVDLRDGRVRAVRTADGEALPADAVVCCAGPWSDGVCRLVGFEPLLTRSPGLVVVTEPAPVSLQGIVKAPGVSMRSDGGGRVLLSGDFAEATPDPAAPPGPDDPEPREALRRARALVPGLAGVRVEAARVGVRPLPADGLPLVGPVPGADGFHLAVTHSGVTLAPVLGRLVAQEVRSGSATPELDPFRPDRAGPG